MLFPNQTNSISAQSIQRIARCRGWVITFAIFLFLYGGLLILGLLGSFGQGASGMIPAMINLFLGGFYVTAGVNFCKFSSNIRLAADNLNPHNLEIAMQCQANAWMWLGICAIIYFIATLIILFITLIG